MAEEQKGSSRPYWYVDAKWICGLLLAVALGFTVAVYSLARITAEGPAIDTLSQMMVDSYQPGLLERGGQVDLVREQLEALAQRLIASLFGVPLPPAQSHGQEQPRPSLEVVRPLAQAFYRGGTVEARRLASEIDSREQLARLIPDDKGLWSIFSLRVHDILQRAMWVSVAASVLLTVALVSFSSRFGRLGSPGVVAAVVGAPGLWLSSAMSHALRQVSNVPQMQKPPLAWLLGQVDLRLLQIVFPLLDTIMETYRIVTIVGLGMMTVALVGSLIWRLSHH